MNKYLSIVIRITVSLVLASCGDSKQDRVLSGAGIGAGVGAAAGALTGNALPGATIGAGVGAATGAITDRNDIDLGRPIWKR